MVGCLELRRRQVAAGLVEPAGVPEVDPLGRRQLDLLDRPAGFPPFDELSLVQAVDGLGQGVEAPIVVKRRFPAPETRGGPDGGMPRPRVRRSA